MTTLLILALSLSAFATPPAPVGVQYFSLCGGFDATARELHLVSGDKVDISPSSPAPKESGDFCFRGPELRHFEKDNGRWEFSPKGFSPVGGDLNFPVLICSVLKHDSFRTTWNGGTLSFRGPFPERKKEFGWCADGVSLPVKEKKGWLFDAGRFREMPDPGLRSGMSIGNQ